VIHNVPDQHLILVGLPGVGKSTIGSALAKRLERLFYDFDKEIERSAGLSVTGIFTQHGEAAFRAAEVQVSQQLAAGHHTPAVLAPGGGWIANLEAVAHLRPVSRIIYLRVSPTQAVQRLGKGIGQRPLFQGKAPEVVMQELYERRHPLYQAAANLTVETDGAGYDEVLRRVLEQFRRSVAIEGL
jgi:shikimate kinase